jgi:sigma-E factor negative regulatory protein RseB
MLTLAAVAPLWTAPAVAEPYPAPSGNDPQALALLDRAMTAAQRTPYAGLQFVSTWDGSDAASFLVEVDHVPGQGTAVRVQPTAMTAGSETFTPEGGVGGLGSAGSGELEVLGANYDLALVGAEPVAGRHATVVAVSRRGVAAARFWVDTATGLMLRREDYDQQGRIVRASAFVNVSFGAPVMLKHLPPQAARPWREQVSSAELATMRDNGWTCPIRLLGSLPMYDARRVDGEQGPILHLSYSDGLSSISLFEQRGRLDAGRLVGFRQDTIDGAAVHVTDGYPRRAVWSAGGTVYTLIADAPAETMAAALASLPHDRDESGILDRVRRGIGRVGSWLNPFG